MTSNLAESVNALLKQNREYTIVCLFESIKSIMTRLFVYLSYSTYKFYLYSSQLYMCF